MDTRKRIKRQLEARRLIEPKQKRNLQQSVKVEKKELVTSSSEKFSGLNRFLLQVVISACIFFAIGIVYQSNDGRIEPAQAVVKGAFEDHFQFAAVSDFFERNFGSPLKLLPDQRATEPEAEHLDYAVPASGTIRESFEEDGEGILLETGAGEEVKAVKGGHVLRITAEDHSDLGNMVELQHPDGTTSIYGMLNEVMVQPYDIVKSGAALGTVTEPDNEQSGLFYFAIKQGGNYINPSEVIKFD